ncbi:MAG: protein-disulfide reductase DsbD [Gammaproteobacteria bacterium]|nr:protein-disulfide reductase DsbD [Gammaproteobacteria bacterium]
MKPVKHLLSLSALILISFLFQHPAIASGGSGLFDSFGMNQDDILDVNEAFRLSTEITGSAFIARLQIAEGHYLYRDKIQIQVEDVDIKAGELQLPAGESKDDPIFNTTLFVFHQDVEATLPFRYTGSGDKEVVFKVKYQGCSEIAGICYPPQTKTVTATLLAASAVTAESETATTESSDEKPVDATPAAKASVAEAIQVSEQDKMSDALRSGNIWLTLLAFFAAGLLLAFTPCVFPMIPILMGIIVGQDKQQGVKKSFTLSLVYVLAMASTYTIIGILVGLSGENIQAWFQNPWIIGSFAAIFVALAFSMFGFYDLQMPSAIQTKLTQISHNQRGGTLLGTAIMGFLSALIVGPCVTAPLVGALIYIAETGDAVLGGMALFSLSMGMGAPLLLLGASAGKILPKAGTWMETTKAVFGVMLLGLGIWLLERVAPPAATMTLWAALLIISAIYMGALTTLNKGESGWHKLWKGLGIILLIYGIAIFIGMMAGNRSIFQPLQGLGASATSLSTQATSNQQASAHLNFKQIKGVEGLNAALAEAKAQNKKVMLDFYADWCVSCKEMEALTFSDPAVQQALAGMVLLQADVTPNDEKDRELYKHFGIIGPPSIMFFDRDGNELKNYRIVGYMKAEQFTQHIQRSAIQ